MASCQPYALMLSLDSISRPRRLAVPSNSTKARGQPSPVSSALVFLLSPGFTFINVFPVLATGSEARNLCGPRHFKFPFLSAVLLSCHDGAYMVVVGSPFVS